MILPHEDGSNDQCKEKRNICPCSHSNIRHLPVHTGWYHKNLILYWDNRKRTTVSLPWQNYQLRWSIIVITPEKKKRMFTCKENPSNKSGTKQWCGKGTDSKRCRENACMDDTWEKVICRSRAMLCISSTDYVKKSCFNRSNSGWEKSELAKWISCGNNRVEIKIGNLSSNMTT